MSVFVLAQTRGSLIEVEQIDVAEYHRRIEAGELPDDDASTELVDGYVAHRDRSGAGEGPMSIGDRHVYCVRRLDALGRKLSEPRCFMQTQQPVVLEPRDEPQPDGSIIAGDARAMLRKPVASEVIAVFEVSDSTLAYDRETKQRIYATAGLPQYVIVNIPERQVEVYLNPDPAGRRYDAPRILRGRDPVQLSVPGGTLEFAADDLLPPA